MPVEKADFRSGNSPENHVVTAIPESIVGGGVHILVGIVRSDLRVAVAVLNEVRRGKAWAGKHGSVIVLLSRARPGLPKIRALDDARVLRCLAFVGIAGVISVHMAGDCPIERAVKPETARRFPV